MRGGEVRDRCEEPAVAGGGTAPLEHGDEPRRVVGHRRSQDLTGRRARHQFESGEHDDQLACRSLTSCVVSALPPMLHSPLATSSMVTQVTGRMASPSMSTIVSVRRVSISCFWLSSNTPLMSFTERYGTGSSWIVGPAPPDLYTVDHRPCTSRGAGMAGAAPAPCKGVGQTADVDFRVLGT